MKLISKALLAAGLVALSACGGGGEEENSAANNTASEDLYNVGSDDLGADNLLGNEGLGNDLGLDNATTNSGETKGAAENASGNSL